jgi:imidazole glycerol phosphate synthase glutamine amidotransferase subunit
MIGILDYGMGNLGSVRNTCRALGISHTLVSSASQLDAIDGLLVPGQGAFRDCMGHLRAHGFIDPLRAWIAADRPFFGICMGLQVLFEASEESPGVEGLAVLPGLVRRFPAHAGLKVPQMGWNRVAWSRADNPVLPAALDGRHFYFVHSFHVPLTDAPWVGGITSYGSDYVSAVSFGECHAVQFHPEKSQRDGLALLKAFADRVAALTGTSP